jgi:thioredoxin
MTTRIETLREYFDVLARGRANGRLVVIDFYAEWCEPCKKLRPVLDSLSEQYKLRVDVYRVNVDESSEIADHQTDYRDERVESLPTIKFYVEGKIKDSIKGYNEKVTRAKFAEWSQY